MKTKQDITVGVITHVTEYTVANMEKSKKIKVDKIKEHDKWGDEIQIYYPELSGRDEVYINGVRYTPDEG